MPASQSEPRSSQNVCAITLGFGSRNSCTSNAATRPCQAARPSTKTSRAGAQSPSRRCTTARLTAALPDGRRFRPAAQTAERAKPAPPETAIASDGSRRELRLELRAAAGEPLAHVRDELEEARVLPRLDRPRVWQVDVDDPGDAAGTRRHHDDARGEEDGLGDRVRYEDDRRAARVPDAQQLEVQALARHLVEGAERLVHQQ